MRYINVIGFDNALLFMSKTRFRGHYGVYLPKYTRPNKDIKLEAVVESPLSLNGG